ncbi:MAG: N-acetylmuramoyl-L-alanine amidase, partial [Clostridia bacterium]|nr:N-acetylmuramoyl-L-alanine amidase [Clostridia bacterium]
RWVCMLFAGLVLIAGALCVYATEPQYIPFQMKGKEVVVATTKQEIWLRSGPGFSYPVIGKVEHCTELKVLEKGIWYKVEEAGKIGYVYGSTFNSEDEYLPGRLNGLIVGLDPDGQVVMDISTETISPWGSTQKPKMDERIFGVNSNTPDYEVNLNVVKILKRILELEGARVVLTKEDASVNLSNAQRAQILGGEGESKVKCHVVLRISCNSGESKDASGVTSSLQSNATLRYENLSNAIIDRIAQCTGLSGVPATKTGSDTFLNWSRVPAITIELGYLTNEYDEKILVDPQYQTAIADCIRDGILECFYGVD